MMTSEQAEIFLDPSYEVFGGGKLFDITDPVLNRDDTLLPFHRLKDAFAGAGIRVETADRLLADPSVTGDYYSLGILRDVARLAGDPRIRLKGFAIYEPPAVAPHLYEVLPLLTRYFEQVHVHNLHGHGYSLAGVDVGRLRKLRFPQPHWGVREPFWHHEDRLERLVVINGNKKPAARHLELYSKRIEAIVYLAAKGKVDLYGTGWDRLFPKVGRLRRQVYWPALRHHKALQSVYRGTCGSKYEVLSRYRYCLCFENMAMEGYVTEKIFDCLYAGTIPVYWGAPDIAEHVDREAFIDFGRMGSYDKLAEHLAGMTTADVAAMREAGRRYMKSERFRPFYEALHLLVGRGGSAAEGRLEGGSGVQ